MRNRTVATRLALALTALIAVGAGEPATGPTAHVERSPQAILADLQAITDPVYDSAKIQADPQAREAYLKARQEAMAKKAPLTLELYKVSPDAPELQKLLPVRWQYLAQAGQRELAITEITAYLAGHPNPQLQPIAANQRVLLALESAKDAAGRQLPWLTMRRLPPTARACRT